MKKCPDCDYFGGKCEKPEKVCDKYKKTIYREYIKVEAEDEN